jgi:hypothetical protein
MEEKGEVLLSQSIKFTTLQAHQDHNSQRLVHKYLEMALQEDQ